MEQAAAEERAGGLPVSDGCCSPAPTEQGVHDGLASLLQRYDVNEYAASVKVFAVKPR